MDISTTINGVTVRITADEPGRVVGLDASAEDGSIVIRTKPPYLAAIPDPDTPRTINITGGHVTINEPAEADANNEAFRQDPHRGKPPAPARPPPLVYPVQRNTGPCAPSPAEAIAVRHLNGPDTVWSDLPKAVPVPNRYETIEHEPMPSPAEAMEATSRKKGADNEARIVTIKLPWMIPPNARAQIEARDGLLADWLNRDPNHCSCHLTNNTCLRCRTSAVLGGKEPTNE